MFVLRWRDGLLAQLHKQLLHPDRFGCCDDTMGARVWQQEPEESHGQADHPYYKGHHGDEGRAIARLHADVGNRVRRARRDRWPDELNGVFGIHK